MLEIKVVRLIFSLLLINVVLTDATQDANSNSEFIAIPGRYRKASLPLTLGDGVSSSDLPIVRCIVDPKYPTNTTLEVITRDGSRCNVTFTDTKTEVVSPHQLPGKKVLLHVRQSLNVQDNVVTKDNLTLVDMNSCAGVYNVSLPAKAKQVFPYEDGSYDVVLQVREGLLDDHLQIEHVDASGHQFGDLVNISMNLQQTDVQPASTKSTDRGLFVRGRSVLGNDPGEFKFVNGSQVKDVLQLNSRMQLVSHLDADRYYTVCGQDRDDSDWVKIDCARYDMETGEVFKAQFEWNRYDVTRYVRGSDSGIVLVAVEEKNHFIEKLVIAEARPDERPWVRRIDAPWRSFVMDNCRVQDFDGAARTFTLACEVTFPKRGVAFHKYKLAESKSWI